MPDTIGIIAIGRNEGERLRACLRSLADHAPADAEIVYVDSGSTDASVTSARQAGAEVVELDLSTPFTAARARNEGVQQLLSLSPEVTWIFFLDGDCRLCPGFLDQALSFLQSHPDYAVVCGRRREVNPTRNWYHRLADMEWNTPLGEATACGGDALFRRSAFQAVGGYNPKLIAGEEPELCVRLRLAGHRVYRLDADMTLHDVDMTRFSQWWSRSVRAGYAFVMGATMHGNSPQRHWRRQAIRPWVWAVGLPMLIVVSAIVLSWWALLLVGLYVLPLVGAFRFRRRLGSSAAESLLFSFACLISKWAEVRGQLKFLASRASGRQSALIEYKKPVVPV